MSQTVITGNFTNDTILRKEYSPYVVQSNITIGAGVKLIIDAGVTVKFNTNVTLTVNGTLLVNGTINDSVYLISSSASTWNGIVANNGNISLNYFYTSGSYRFLNITGGEFINIRNCYIKSEAKQGNGGDCIAAHDTKKITIDSMKLIGSGGIIATGSKNDAIDLDAVDSCFISNSEIANFSDDAIDIGTQSKYALIKSNIVHNTNYGISIGENSVAYLENNISYLNDAGIQAHNDAIVYSLNNILYNNTVGIEAYHSEEGETVQSGGGITIVNTIFSASGSQDIVSQSSSSVEVSYSISDKGILPGSHNLNADPMLNNPAIGDFSLKDNSPCLNAGAPDEHGKPTTIGKIDNPVVTEIIRTKAIDFIIYPNPFVKEIFLRTSNKMIYTYSIIDLQGRELQSGIFKQQDKINLEHLKVGGYYFVISAANNKVGSWLILKK